MRRKEDIVCYDFQGWPEYKMNFREVLAGLQRSYRSIGLYPYAQKRAFLAILCRGCGPVCALEGF